MIIKGCGSCNQKGMGGFWDTALAYLWNPFKVTTCPPGEATGSDGLCYKITPGPVSYKTKGVAPATKSITDTLTSYLPYSVQNWIAGCPEGQFLDSNGVCQSVPSNTRGPSVCESIFGVGSVICGGKDQTSAGGGTDWMMVGLIGVVGFLVVKRVMK